MKRIILTLAVIASAYAVLHYLYCLATVVFGNPWLAAEAVIVGASAAYGATAMAEACYSQWRKK